VAQYIPEGHALIRYEWSLIASGTPMVSSIGVQHEPDADPSLVTEHAVNAFLNGFPLNLTLGSGYRFVGATGYFGPTPDPVVYFHPVGLNGGGTFAPAAPHTCMLIKKRTLTPGRKGRGRMFLPAGYVSEGEVNEAGVFSSPGQGAATTRVNEFFSGLQGQETDTEALMGAVLFHQTSGTGQGDYPSAITQLIADPMVATQRERLRR
jgi:hypothetical protein